MPSNTKTNHYVLPVHKCAENKKKDLGKLCKNHEQKVAQVAKNSQGQHYDSTSQKQLKFSCNQEKRSSDKNCMAADDVKLGPSKAEHFALPQCKHERTMQAVQNSNFAVHRKIQLFIMFLLFLTLYFCYIHCSLHFVKLAKPATRFMNSDVIITKCHAEQKRSLARIKDMSCSYANDCSIETFYNLTFMVNTNRTDHFHCFHVLLFDQSGVEYSIRFIFQYQGGDSVGTSKIVEWISSLHWRDLLLWQVTSKVKAKSP